VSGDLYWFAEKNSRTVVAAADCTGHGVPGALLSLIGVSLFRETVLERGVVRPEGILEALRTGVIDALNGQGDEEEGHRDGMNVSVVSIDRQAMQLDYAGAYAPIFIVRQGELIELKGDRIPVGYHDGELRAFTGTSMPLQKGDRIYLFSDGLQDQFGGPQGKKLRSSGLKEWVLNTAELSMDDQYQTISDRFRLWKGREEQIDDVLLIGLEV
jgi:serine phosphatase RsbU (regulator of sigma subunit)